MSWSECCGCVMTFSAACQRHMMVQYCCGSGSTKKLYYRCSLLFGLFIAIRQSRNSQVVVYCIVITIFIRGHHYHTILACRTKSFLSMAVTNALMLIYLHYSALLLSLEL